MEFHFRARAIILSNGSVLATRVKGMDYSFLPGGHVELGESIPFALKRELREELGKDIEIGPYLGAIEQSWIAQKDGPQCEINHIFLCETPELKSSDEIMGLEENFEFFWLKPEEFDSANLLPLPARDLLKRYIAGDHSIWWASQGF